MIKQTVNRGILEGNKRNSKGMSVVSLRRLEKAVNKENKRKKHKEG